jgi:membrane protein DedA with SNARE-associated domain
MVPSEEQQLLDRAAPSAAPRAAGRRWVLIARLEYALLGAVVCLITALAFAFFYFDIDIAKLTTYGYIGVFAIGFISAASIVLPMPGVAAIVGGGALLDPILGIPAPIMVGLVGGVAEALGELTGYAAGFGGSAIIQERSFYPVVENWMRRHGLITVFALSAVPNPLLDLAGVAAGATRMPILRFFLGVWGGKTVKNIYLASGGLALGEALRALFG